MTENRPLLTLNHRSGNIFCSYHLEKQSTQKTFSMIIPTKLDSLMSVASLIEVKSSIYLHICGLT